MVEIAGPPAFGATDCTARENFSMPLVFCAAADGKASTRTCPSGKNQSCATSFGKLAGVIVVADNDALSWFSSAGKNRVTAAFIAISRASGSPNNFVIAASIASTGEFFGNWPATFAIWSCAACMAARIAAGVTGATAVCGASAGARMVCACASMASFTVCCAGTKVAPEITAATCGSADNFAAIAVAAARLGVSASA